MIKMHAVRIGFRLMLGMVALAFVVGCRTPEQRRQIKAYGLVVDATQLPFACGDDVATVRLALKSSLPGTFRLTPELIEPMPKWHGYRLMSMQCGKRNNPKKRCGLFLFFSKSNTLEAIYAAHPLDVCSAPQIDVNWIAGKRLPRLEAQDQSRGKDSSRR